MFWACNTVQIEAGVNINPTIRDVCKTSFSDVTSRRRSFFTHKIVYIYTYSGVFLMISVLLIFFFDATSILRLWRYLTSGKLSYVPLFRAFPRRCGHLAEWVYIYVLYLAKVGCSNEHRNGVQNSFSRDLYGYSIKLFYLMCKFILSEAYRTPQCSPSPENFLMHSFQS